MKIMKSTLIKIRNIIILTLIILFITIWVWNTEQVKMWRYGVDEEKLDNCVEYCQENNFDGYLIDMKNQSYGRCYVKLKLRGNSELASGLKAYNYSNVMNMEECGTKELYHNYTTPE